MVAVRGGCVDVEFRETDPGVIVRFVGDGNQADIADPLWFEIGKFLGFISPPSSCRNRGTPVLPVRAEENAVAFYPVADVVAVVLKWKLRETVDITGGFHVDRDSDRRLRIGIGLPESRSVAIDGFGTVVARLLVGAGHGPALAVNGNTQGGRCLELSRLWPRSFWNDNCIGDIQKTAEA